MQKLTSDIFVCVSRKFNVPKNHRVAFQHEKHNQKALTLGHTDHFSNILAGCEFSAGCYLLKICNSGLLLSHGVVTSNWSPNFTFTFNQSIAYIRELAESSDRDHRVWPI